MILFCPLPVSAADDLPTAPVDADILLRQGLIHRGDGRPAQVGDCAIRGDRIVAVGQFPIGKVGQDLDCRGLVVCPGFIDLHNHSDEALLQTHTRAVSNYVTQGCTTIVTGNCGFGPVDVAAYYASLDAHGIGVNVVHLVPQGSLRQQVMGDELRAPSDRELRAMRQVCHQAMLDGAWGMSSGLIYVPSSYADLDELASLAHSIGTHGGIYASHIRNENVELLAAVEEALEIGRRGKLPVHISHFKSSGQNSWGLVRVAAQAIQQARASGQSVTADQYPYAASSTSLEATLIPPWARAGGREAMLARFDDPIDGRRIREAIGQKLRELDDGQRLQLARYAAEPTWSGQRISAVAEASGESVLETAMQILRNGGASVVNHSIDEQDVRFVMTMPWVATASDGSAQSPPPRFHIRAAMGLFLEKSATMPSTRTHWDWPRRFAARPACRRISSVYRIEATCGPDSSPTWRSLIRPRFVTGPRFAIPINMPAA